MRGARLSARFGAAAVALGMLFPTRIAAQTQAQPQVLSAPPDKMMVAPGGVDMRTGREAGRSPGGVVSKRKRTR